MDIVINVPDNRAADLIEGYAKRNGYQEKIKNVKKDDGSLIDNPQSKKGFLVSHTCSQWKQITDAELVQQESAKAAEAKQKELAAEKW